MNLSATFPRKIIQVCTKKYSVFQLGKALLNFTHLQMTEIKNKFFFFISFGNFLLEKNISLISNNIPQKLVFPY